MSNKDHSDNVAKMKSMINDTIDNIKTSEEALKATTGEQQEAIKKKNENRREAIEAWREAIREELS